MAEKKRLDSLLVERGLIDSRERAKAVIMAGHVYVKGEPSTTAGKMLPEDIEIEVKNYEKKYVSRGGYKLEKALDVFNFELQDAICIDAGASTGGFTDCMLKNGAKMVYAVDVGYGQLAWSLRTDERVVNLERTNVRYLSDEQIGHAVDFISCDLSFISLALVLPALTSLMKEGASIVALVKPQFEARREDVGKRGVVKDISVHREVLKKIYNACIDNSLCVKGIDFSPITGPNGNIEFLIHAIKSGDASEIIDIDSIVDKAREELVKK